MRDDYVIKKRKKIFVLGVGAQKAGTTWLRKNLQACSNTNMGFCKEYHIFDAHYIPIQKFLWDAPSVNPGNHGGKWTKNGLKRYSFLHDIENYFDYFDYLHLKEDKVELVGDFTPAYAGLGRKGFVHIKNGLEERGFTVKVVFLMRDPFERCWSSTKQKFYHYPSQGIESAVQMLQEIYKIRNPVNPKIIKDSHLKHHELRTRYDKTIIELEKVFAPEQIFYGFYVLSFYIDNI